MNQPEFEVSRGVHANTLPIGDGPLASSRCPETHLEREKQNFRSGDAHCTNMTFEVIDSSSGMIAHVHYSFRWPPDSPRLP